MARRLTGPRLASSPEVSGKWAVHHDADKTHNTLVVRAALPLFSSPCDRIALEFAMADGLGCPHILQTLANGTQHLLRRHPRHMREPPERHHVQAIRPPNTIHSESPVTPINLILFTLFAFIVYLRLKPGPPQTLPRAPPPTVFRTFTPPTLFPYNGLNDMPVYLAVRGRIFDVTSGRNFYGPGGPYANFAGRDASRGLACGSFDEDMLTKDLDGPLDTLQDLDAEQMEAMRGWEERFEEKYLVVGKLVPVGSPEADVGKA